MLFGSLPSQYTISSESSDVSMGCWKIAWVIFGEIAGCVWLGVLLPWLIISLVTEKTSL